jgi:hypothetical protein
MMKEVTDAGGNQNKMTKQSEKAKLQNTFLSCQFNLL